MKSHFLVYRQRMTTQNCVSHKDSTYGFKHGPVHVCISRQSEIIHTPSDNWNYQALRNVYFACTVTSASRLRVEYWQA